MMNTMTDEMMMERLSMIPSAEVAADAERWKDEILMEEESPDDAIGVVQSGNF